jgi:rSAM/selenodomain-associated transferase 1
VNNKEQITDTAVVVMARYPTLGQTKTRLARTLSDHDTVNLYRAFLTDLIRHHAGQVYTFCWTYTPANVDYQALIETLASAISAPVQGMCYFPQQGVDLGERLHHAFHWTHDRGYQYTFVIGSDSPHLRRETIAQARTVLDEADVVLGPADDGGYDLIGMKRPHDVFSNIPMSTPHVTTMTIEAAKRQGLRVQMIETLFDVDEMPDLQRLATLLMHDRTLAPATAAYLEHIRMIS